MTSIRKRNYEEGMPFFEKKTSDNDGRYCSEAARHQEESMLQMTFALVKDCTYYSNDAFKLCSKVLADKVPGDFMKDI